MQWDDELKVAFFLHNAGVIHGAERATLELVRGLKDRGVTIELWLIEELRGEPVDTAFEDAFLQLGITLRRLPSTSACSRSLVNAIRQTIQELQPDVLHTIGYKANVHVRLALFKIKHPPVWVTTVHGWLYRRQWKERIYGWLECWAMRRADAVVALSRYYVSLLQEILPRQQINYIPTGLSDEDFAALGSAQSMTDKSPLVFGMCGRLSEEKNHALFLESVAHLKHKGDHINIKCVIAGSGPLHADIEQQIQRSGIEQVVTVAGHVDRLTFFEQVDVLVQCSKIENRPYTIMEAGAAGVPVIGTRVGGIPEMIEHEQSGLLVKENVAELTEAMRRLANDSSFYEQLSRGAKRHAEKHFQLDSSIEAHLDFYPSLVNGEAVQ